MLKHADHLLGTIHRGKIYTNKKIQIINTNSDSSELLVLFCQI